MGKLVYIIEEPSLAEMCAMGLELFPGEFNASTFPCSAEALTAFCQASEKPRIVTASLILMGGLELAYQLKSRDPSVRFLLTSGCSPETVSEAIRTADVVPDALLHKPFNIETYCIMMRALASEFPLPLGSLAVGAWPFNRRPRWGPFCPP